MKRLIVVLLLLLASSASAATVVLEVDPLGQQFDSIRIHTANIPRDFVFSEPPAYAGPGTPTGSGKFLVSVAGLTPGQTYKFIAVLTRGSEFSPGSNVVEQRLPVVVLKLQAPVVELKEVLSE